MLQIEVWSHPLFSGSVIVDPAKSGVLLVTARHAGKIRNCGNLRRTARHCQINAPFQLTGNDIKLRLRICKEKCDYFWKHMKRHQRQHLNQCLERAQEWEGKAAECQILAIIKREKDQAF